MQCPYCHSNDVNAEFVDVEVGWQQVTPYECGNCGAGQMNPYHKDENASAEEKRIGWFRPPPDWCRHNWRDIGLDKAEYVCDWCKSKMEDFKLT
jgi:protein-arginine kinase activator protein McsA